MLENTESAIRNKLKNLLTKLGEYKFVTALGFKFEKIESDNKTIYRIFYSNSLKQLLMRVLLMMYLNQSKVEL